LITANYRKWGLVLGILLLLLLGVDTCDRPGSRWKTWLLAEAGKLRHLNLATVAMVCDREPEVNRRKIEAMVIRIRNERPSTQLIVFGEVILGWYDMSKNARAYFERIAEPIPGVTTRLVSDLARRYQIHISFGLAEKAEGGIFNAQVVIDPQGRIVSRHRKMDPHHSAFLRGSAPVTMVDIQGIRTALVICYDIRNPAVDRVIKRDSADLLVLSQAELADPWDPDYFGIDYLARRFGIWMVTCNHVGWEGRQYWDGLICVSNPLGDYSQKSTDREGYLYHEIAVPVVKSSFKTWCAGWFLPISRGYLVAKNPNIALRYVHGGRPLPWYLRWYLWLLVVITLGWGVAIWKKRKKGRQTNCAYTQAGSRRQR